MLSQEAEQAMGLLAEGAVLNPLHTTARELIDVGFACNDFGRLALTEAGRVWTRRSGGRRFVIEDDQVHEMRYQNPMGLGPEVPADIGFLPKADDMPRAPQSAYDQGLRAAGIASGKTGEWPTSEWVHAFIDAYTHGGKGAPGGGSE